MMQNSVLKWLRVMVLCLAVMLYLLVLTGSIYEAIVFPQQPLKVTLAQAVELDLKHQPTFMVFDKALYLSITDAAWECASVKQTGYKGMTDRRSTDAVFTDAEQTAVVFIRVNGFFSCPELKESEISGVLQRIDSRPVRYQSDTKGLMVIDKDSAARVYGFCTHCTPSAAVGVPVVWLLLPFIIWGMIKRWKSA